MQASINPSPSMTRRPAPSQHQVPYPHLLNFFESTQSSKSSTASPARLAAQLHRLFAYVGVPSRFANAQLQIPPVAAATGGNAFLPYALQPDFPIPGTGPHQSQYGDELRRALRGLNMYCPPVQANSQLNPVFWDKFVRSRRGDGAMPAQPMAHVRCQHSLGSRVSRPT